MKLVLLPGLDGTGRLFAPLVQALPPALEPVVVRYPEREVLDVPALLRAIQVALPPEPFVLLGESFSGPLAVRVAAQRPAGLRGLVLVASFVRSPVGPLLSGLGRIAARFVAAPLPAAALRYFLAGADAPAGLVAEVSGAIRSVGAPVLASRLRLVLATDVSAELGACEVPVQYLEGARDRLVLPGAAQEVRRAAAFPLELVTLDAPHLVLQRRPVEAAAAIGAFAARVVR